MNSKNKQQIKFVLYIEFSNAIKNDKNLLNDYWERIRKHNKNMLNDDYYDSGFDLLMSNKNIKILKNEVKLVSLGIKCACYKFNTIHPNKIPVYNVLQTYKLGMLKGVHPHPFKLFPRSSMWKKGVLLANCTGVIDSGYRGEVMLKFDKQGDNHYDVGDRIGQLMLIPIPSVQFVEVLMQLKRLGWSCPSQERSLRLWTR